MAQISEHIIFLNRKIYSYNQMRKTIFDLGSNTGKNNENPSPQLTHIHNSIIMSSVDTTENVLSNVYRKSDMKNYVHLQ